jgi:hypothetical protein
MGLGRVVENRLYRQQFCASGMPQSADLISSGRDDREVPQTD